MRKLRRIRAEKGLTMDTLEERAGVSKRTISEIERGVRTPHTLTLAKLANALEVDLDELLEDEAPKGRSPHPENWASSYPDEGFRRAVEEAPTEELREAIKSHVGNRPAQTLEDYRRDNPTAKTVGEARVRVFAHALIVDQELRSRGEEPPGDYLPDFRDWLKATGLD